MHLLKSGNKSWRNVEPIFQQREGGGISAGFYFTCCVDDGCLRLTMKRSGPALDMSVFHGKIKTKLSKPINLGTSFQMTSNKVL